MGVWQGTIYFADSRGTRVMRITFPNAAGVFDGAEFLSAKTAVGDLATALAAASDASVGHALTFYEAPVSPGSVDDAISVSNALSLTAYLNGTTPAGFQKTWNFRIPAPNGTTLLPDNDTANVTAGTLVAVMGALQSAQTFGMRVSDNDTIDFSAGSNGLKGGSWYSVKSSK